MRISTTLVLLVCLQNSAFASGSCGILSSVAQLLSLGLNHDNEQIRRRIKEVLRKKGFESHIRVDAVEEALTGKGLANSEKKLKEINDELKTILKSDVASEDLRPKIGSGQYMPPPQNLDLKGFKKSNQRFTSVEGGGGKRARWYDEDGKIYEWDSQHAELEVYSSNGCRHLGAMTITGEYKEKPPRKVRKVCPCGC
ncbi:MAG: hypothetical protein COT74_13750 [Bdellovibrionales bacterium CG10_big_fil_rev_8_21_14_0_10_45_34]|nr:MAG: hypothetical protein COT74_13750 [Bdellovibrionales bacterium CG10_big_fil_rev_8_21_14_0_10_45_34]